MRASVHDEYRRAADEHWWFRARREIFARILDGCEDLPTNLEILDVGPGSGVNLSVLCPRGDVTVLDLDRSSLAACAAGGAEHVVYGDVQNPPLDNDGYDLVTALDVLEHLDDDARALKGLHRVLRPDGHLLVSVPALGVLWGRQDVLSHHRRRYRRGQLRRRLTDAGFEVARISYFNTALFLPILAARLAMRPFLSRSVARDQSDLEMRLPLGLDGLLYRVFATEAPWLARHDLPFGVSILALARPRRE